MSREDAPDLREEVERRLADLSSLAFRVAYGVLRQREDAEDVAQAASPDLQSMHGNVVFKDVVTSVKCKARPLSGERFALACEFDQDSVYSPNGGDSEETKAKAALTPPVVRRFGSQTTLVLRDGQTVQHFATDPLSGEVLEVDVTLHVVK